MFCLNFREVNFDKIGFVGIFVISNEEEIVFWEMFLGFVWEMDILEIVIVFFFLECDLIGILYWLLIFKKILVMLLFFVFKERELDFFMVFLFVLVFESINFVLLGCWDKMEL